jgi:hypothetical protein
VRLVQTHTQYRDDAIGHPGPRRLPLGPKMWGLQLADAKAILGRLQEILVSEQLQRYCEAVRPCPRCHPRRTAVRDSVNVLDDLYDIYAREFRGDNFNRDTKGGGFEFPGRDGKCRCSLLLYVGA